MSHFYSKSELNRFKKYKKYYRELGKSEAVARQYSWDHILIERKVTR